MAFTMCRIVEGNFERRLPFSLEYKYHLSLSIFDVWPISALKIHMSKSTKELLEKFPGYNIEPRGEIEVKVRDYFF